MAIVSFLVSAGSVSLPEEALVNASLSSTRRREHQQVWSGRLAAVLGALSLAALFGGCSAAPQPAQVPSVASPEASLAATGFTILQINDTYKIEGLRAGAEGGFSRVRTLRKKLESGGRPVLVLHAGDFLFPSVMSKYLQAVPMIEALNLLDGSEEFDGRLFVTPGNHEFDNPDPQILFDRIAQSKFTWLATNIAVAPGGGAAPDFQALAERFPNVKDHVVLDLGGIRVGVFSLTVDDQRRPWLEYGYDFAHRRATVKRVLDDLEREGAEFVVGLTHQEIGEDEALAREFGDRIDWIVGGHEHVAQFLRVGATTITKADADAKTAYRIDVRPTAGGERPAFTATDRGTDKPTKMALVVPIKNIRIRVTRINPMIIVLIRSSRVPSGGSLVKPPRSLRLRRRSSIR